MKILYLGDIMGESGMAVVEAVLPALIQAKKIDLVIAQAENTSEGRGITVKDFRRLQSAGVDFCTGGNWSLYRKDIEPLMADPQEPIIRPANSPPEQPEQGYKYITKNNQTVLVVSLLGTIVGKDADKPMHNPLQTIEDILKKTKGIKTAATIVNFHGDYSSEKVIIGHFLDGKVTGVIGDHWHIPTADARVLPKGTAHITDVGMCGILNASLGITLESVIPRWQHNRPTRNILANLGPKQFNAVLINTNKSGLSDSIEQIQKVL